VVGSADNAVHDAVDVREAALEVAVVEYLDRRARVDRPSKQEQFHVRAAPGALIAEEAQAGAGNAVEVRITVRHHLVGFLGGGVQRQRMSGRLVFAEGHPDVGAINRTGGREHEVFDAMVAAAFQNVQEIGDVAADVDVRVLRGVMNAGLRGEVHHACWLVFREAGFDRLAVGQISLNVGVVRVVHKAGQTCLFQVHVVVVAQVVEADHVVPRARLS